jgi:hypothetical protein
MVSGVREWLILVAHLIVTIVKIATPGGAHSVVAESLILKHQLLILNRSRKRAPKLGAVDRVLLGLGALLVSPRRLLKVTIAIRPATLLRFHRALRCERIPTRRPASLRLAIRLHRPVSHTNRRLTVNRQAQGGIAGVISVPRLRFDHGSVRSASSGCAQLSGGHRRRPSRVSSPAADNLSSISRATHCGSRAAAASCARSYRYVVQRDTQGTAMVQSRM